MKKNKLYLGFSILFIIIIIIYGIYSFMNHDYVKLNDKDLEIVYDAYNENNIKIPFLNLVSKDIDIVNKDIKDFANSYIDNNSTSNMLNINYLFSRSGKILSVVIICINSDTLGSPDMMFRTYNINLVDNTIISDEELLDYYGYDEKHIQKNIDNYFLDYYNNSSLEKNGCNYDCFIKDKNNYYNGLDDVSYYVKNNKLYVYINMSYKMDFMENNYYSKNNYMFLIK